MAPPVLRLRVVQQGTNAFGANVRSGSFSDLGALNREVCFTPENGHCAMQPACPLSANNGSVL
jgi:hypothetical protein